MRPAHVQAEQQNQQQQRLRAEPVEALQGPHLTPCQLGEGATWSAARAALLWTDIQGQRLWSYEPASGRSQSWPLPGRLGSFALTRDANRLLAAFEHHLAWLDLTTGRSQALAHFEDGLATRANDGRCDRAGNFIFGTFDEIRQGAPAGRWYRYSPDGALRPLDLPPVFIPNGLAFSGDGRRIYFADSMERAVRCADYEEATGAIKNARVFVQLAEGEPDGATVDAEGHYWSAQWGAGRLQRYATGGDPSGQVLLDASQPSCPAFGGPGLSTLFATTAKQGLDAQSLAAQPNAGRVFGVATPWRGLAEPLFGGV